MKVLLILLYLWIGGDGRAEVRLEQIPFSSEPQCQEGGKERTHVLVKEPKFVQGLYAGCAELPVVEAKGN